MLQDRMWYGGSVTKGTHLKSAQLPVRTIINRVSQIKVDGGLEINWVYCNNGHICKGIRKVLCVRHGCGHFGQELLLLGKQIYMKQAWRIF